MPEVLTKDEIDQLLTAIKKGDTEPEKKSESNIRKIRIYDFKRPDLFTKGQLRDIGIIHESFARLCSASLVSIAGTDARVHVASVDQLTYEEFLRSVPTPTTLGIIDMAPIIGNAVIEIDPLITFAILNFMLGGTGVCRERHELTELEKNLMEGVLVKCLENLKESWSCVLDLQPDLKMIETNPQFVQIAPVTEMVILITLEAKVDDTEGMINICYPFLTLEPVLDRLDSPYLYSSKKEAESFNLNTDDIEVPLIAEIFRANIPFGELKKMKKGFVLNAAPSKILKTNEIIIGEWQETESEKHNKIMIKSINTRKEIDYMNEKNNVNTEEVLKPDVLDEIEVQVICELGRTKKTMKEIKSFASGTILELDTLVGEPVNIFANNKLVAKGEVVVIDENYGIRILDSANSMSSDQ